MQNKLSPECHQFLLDQGFKYSGDITLTTFLYEFEEKFVLILQDGIMFVPHKNMIDKREIKISDINLNNILQILAEGWQACNTKAQLNPEWKKIKIPDAKEINQKEFAELFIKKLNKLMTKMKIKYPKFNIYYAKLLTDKTNIELGIEEDVKTC
jgi:hypothetical protein